MLKINNFKITTLFLLSLTMMSWEVRGSQCEVDREACWAQCDSDYTDFESNAMSACMHMNIDGCKADLVSRSDYCAPRQEQCDQTARGCGWTG
jgi:hypothetical protein